MNRILRIEEKLRSLAPGVLEVIDETFMHQGHAGHNPSIQHTHIKIVISDNFGDIKLIEKHRRIKDLLKDEFSDGLHALSIRFV